MVLALKSLLSVNLEKRMLYMHENLCIMRPILADDPALLYCVFDDPWESYCPWNFRIFTQKFKTRKLYVVETRNQLECVRWPLTLKISQGQRSRSSRFYEYKAFSELLHYMRYLKDIICYVVPIQTNHYAFVVKSELWPFTKLLNEKTETLVLRQFQKLLAVHAWKFMYNKT